VHRYRRGELATLLEAHGFVIARATYTHLTLLPILAPLRLLQRRRGLAASDADRRAAIEIRTPPEPLNALATAALLVEAAAARLVPLPAGSSIAVLARKRG
jgi:hypothetical protein